MSLTWNFKRITNTIDIIVITNKYMKTKFTYYIVLYILYKLIILYNTYLYNIYLYYFVISRTVMTSKNKTRISRKPSVRQSLYNNCLRSNGEVWHRKYCNVVPFIYFADATTLLGTNRKSESDDTKSTNSKVATKLTKDDFKTVYFNKITSDEQFNQRKETNKDKVVDLANDQYEVVASSYICVKINKKWIYLRWHIYTRVYIII